MKKTFDGNKESPDKRIIKPSADKGSIKSGTAPAKRPSQRPSSAGPRPNTMPQKTGVPSAAPNAQRPVQRQGADAVAKPTQKQVVKPVERHGEKPASKPVAKPVQKSAPKEVSKKPEKTNANSAVKTGTVVKILMIAVIVLLFVLIGVRGYLFYKDETELLIREITIEAGTVKPEAEMFFKEQPAIPEWVSCNLNFDEVNIDLPQTINFNINMYGKNFACKLIIQDTVAPSGTGIAQKMFTCDEMPDASECVTGITDITDVVATWKDIPDMSEGGCFTATVLLTDGCGNETLVDVPFEVTKDSEAPVIEGTKDLEAYIGDPVTYREKITVTDDYDEDPDLEIDTSQVDLNEPGTYEVTYVARDFTGNESSVTVNLKLSKKPAGYVEPEVVYAEAKKILDEITEPGMTEEEVALQIVWWCRYNIRFILRTSSNSWTEAAYNAFTTRTGNCYSTAYAVKALLDVAGFENMIIERYPYQTATHFWNYVLINGQWYHCDATWREGYDSYFFMYTTAELLDFWQGGWNGFQFKQKEFPESATESVQYRIDYKNHKIKDT